MIFLKLFIQYQFTIFTEIFIVFATNFQFSMYCPQFAFPH